jgi:hypothetical protein
MESKWIYICINDSKNSNTMNTHSDSGANVTNYVQMPSRVPEDLKKAIAKRAGELTAIKGKRVAENAVIIDLLYKGLTA